MADGAEAGDRGCRVTGTLLDARGNRLAEAQAEMAFLSPKRLPMIPAQYRGEMERLFEEIEKLLDSSQG
jgi:hypothetical protein